MTQALVILWWLLVGHAICDYPLQGDFLARAKNHKAPIPGVPWFTCLLAHSFIHAGAVALITGNVGFGLAELGMHTAIDFGKSEGLYDFNRDQLYHVICKVLWAAGWLVNYMLTLVLN